MTIEIDDIELRFSRYTEIKDEYHIGTMGICKKYKRKGVIYYNPSGILYEKYHCIDVYVKYIKQFCIKSKFYSSIYFYGDFWLCNKDFFEKYNALDGYFYIAMIYLGYEFKIKKSGSYHYLVFKAKSHGGIPITSSELF
jgi:hypothetical protein